VRLAFALLLASCIPPKLDDAQHLLESGDPHVARREFDAIARHKKSSPEQKVRALVGASLACDKLEDFHGARDRLERAINIWVPGATEAALYYLAEHIRASDRPRALNLYYRAAAEAEHNLNRGFPYQAATQRLLELSLSR
jgi:hypothetical protein